MNKLSLLFRCVFVPEKWTWTRYSIYVLANGAVYTATSVHFTLPPADRQDGCDWDLICHATLHIFTLHYYLPVVWLIRTNLQPFLGLQNSSRSVDKCIALNFHHWRGKLFMCIALVSVSNGSLNMLTGQVVWKNMNDQNSLSCTGVACSWKSLKRWDNNSACIHRLQKYWFALLLALSPQEQT